MPRWLPCSTVVLIAAAMAGCASVPAAVKFGSLALSGASYLATGKGTTDHLISAIADEDCALLRIIQSRPVCVARVGPAAPPASSDTLVVADAKPASTPPVTPQQRVNPAEMFLVIGSFREEANARRWRDEHSRLDAMIAAPEADADESRYRVVLGPFAESESIQRKTEMASVTHADVWRVRLCADTLSAPPCQLAPPTIVAQR